MIFINDTIFEVYPKSTTTTDRKTTYRYEFMKKDALEKIKKNQPSVNFKTEKLHGQFYQNIAIEKVSGSNIYFKEKDTLNYVKMRIDGKMTKRIYFDGGNKFVKL